MGYSPGKKSSIEGHHFAHPSNKFWVSLFRLKFLSDSGSLLVGDLIEGPLSIWNYTSQSSAQRGSPDAGDV